MSQEKEPRRKDCMPMIVGGDTLSTSQGDYMDFLRIGKECACIHTKTCRRIVELLGLGKFNEGLEMLREVRKEIVLNLNQK